MWAATEGGLTRYSQRTDSWRTYSRADGLPSDALSCLAFDKAGNLYVGTQADGVAVAARKGDYSRWRVTRGPARTPNVPDGTGLPSSLVNCLLVGRDGSVYAGTDGGLARSKDGGLHWRFLRGADWADKVKGLRHGPKPEETWDAGDRMSEDYVTALAEDGSGLLVGHRRTGLDVFDEATGQRVPVGSSSQSLPGTDYVTALLARPEGRAAVGFYGGGIATLVGQYDGREPVVAPPIPFNHLPPLPAPAAPPTLARLNALLRAAEAVRADPCEYRPHALALDDDWATRGDWLGRYGRYWACLCAICSPSDYTWGAGWEPVCYASRMGPGGNADDSLRYWVQWLYTDDPRVLELPPTYLDSCIQQGLTTPALPRREAEQDDHGEEYSREAGGLGVYETVTVPPGLYVLSLYDVNYNGHDGDNRDRDYRLSVRPHRGAALGSLTGFGRAPEWAHGRVTGFWDGVWKRFLVRGPVTLDVEVGRNHSLNAIVPAVTLDLVDETPPPYFGTVTQWRVDQARQKRLWHQLLTGACTSPRFRPSRTEAEAADRLLAALGRAQTINSAWWAVAGLRFYQPLLRWYAARPQLTGAKADPAQLRKLAICYYGVRIYPQWENVQRKEGLVPARDVEKSLKSDGVSESGTGYFLVTTSKASLTDGKSSRDN